MSKLLALLFVGSVLTASTIDPALTWVSGSVQYTWVATQDYGYLPISSEGVYVNGITYGFNPVPPDFGERFQEDFVVALPAERPATTITPEPGGTIAGVALLAFFFWRSLLWVRRRKKGESVKSAWVSEQTLFNLSLKDLRYLMRRRVENRYEGHMHFFRIRYTRQARKILRCEGLVYEKE